MPVNTATLPQLRATFFVDRYVRISMVLVRLVLTSTHSDRRFCRLAKWRKLLLCLIETDQTLYYVGWTVYQRRGYTLEPAEHVVWNTNDRCHRTSCRTSYDYVTSSVNGKVTRHIR